MYRICFIPFFQINVHAYRFMFVLSRDSSTWWERKKLMMYLHHWYLVLGKELFDNLSNLRFFSWFSMQCSPWSKYAFQHSTHVELNVVAQLWDGAFDCSYDIVWCHCLNLAGIFLENGDLGIFLLLKVRPISVLELFSGVFGGGNLLSDQGQ